VRGISPVEVRLQSLAEAGETTEPINNKTAAAELPNTLISTLSKLFRLG
jgi:hypothetical protein